MMAEKQRICSVEGCGKPHKGKGFCGPHYARRWRQVNPGKQWKAPTGVPCQIVGCDRQLFQAGLCKLHYARQRLHGDPLAGRTIQGAGRDWIDAHKDYAGDECLAWPFSDNGHGYGQFNFHGRKMPASRAMCIAAHGAPPTPSHQAAHSCGKGSHGCTNPKHLRWATAAENNADKVKHGTLRSGEASPNARLTAAQVKEIRDTTGNHADIALRFGVSRSNVSMILRGATWKHLTVDDQSV